MAPNMRSEAAAPGKRSGGMSPQAHTASNMPSRVIVARVPRYGCNMRQPDGDAATNERGNRQRLAATLKLVEPRVR